MNTLNELSKTEKIGLLKAIATKEIDAKILTPETLIVSNEQDWFSGLMILTGQTSDEESPSVVFIGKARTAMENTINKIEEDRKLI